MKGSIRVLLFAIAAFVLDATPGFATGLKVVASFSILGDMTSQIGGSDIDLTVLVGPDADVHTFQATPAHARAVAAAQVFIANGRGLDAWSGHLLKSTGSRAQLVNLCDAIAERPGDPHAWHDVRNTIGYVARIRDALTHAAPAGKSGFDQRAAIFIAKLQKVDAEIRSGFDKVPREGRSVITTHDAFGFLGAAYGIRFIAPLGVSTENRPSAKAVAALITQIRRERIKALFLENISDGRLISQIARETGVSTGGKLYSDALSVTSGPAPDYISMIRHNAKLLTAAMAKGS